MSCQGGPSYNESLTEEYDKLRNDLASKEALICSACRALEEFGFDFDLNPELSVWWDKHKQDDAQREKKRDAARLRKERAAILATKPFSELTEAEKKILKVEGYFN